MPSVSARVPASSIAAAQDRGSRLFGCGVVVYAALMLAAKLSGNVWFDELAALALIGLFLLPGLRRRRVLAWIVWFCAAAMLALLGAHGNGRFALDCMPVLINVALCFVFARTLVRNREPLIARIIAALEGRERLMLPRVATYARRLTWAWALSLGIQASVLATLVLCVVPDGLLASLRVAPPIAIGPAWRWYLHLGSYVLVPALLVLEYAFRRWHLRHLPHPPLARFIVLLARRWPSLMRSIADDTARSG
ncbi:xanthomonadin biosynthesis protein [Dokdonella soli]|uniref:xanthomonadin biosynthesis protein n=1 Tax=Dokdonella soli TaxID=529810 RepID=UPI0031D44C2D